MLGDSNRDWTSSTLTDSALAASHCFASFCSACVSFLNDGNRKTSTTTQKPTTSHLVQLPAGIPASLLAMLLIGPPQRSGPAGLAGRLPATVTGHLRWRYP